MNAAEAVRSIIAKLRVINPGVHVAIRCGPRLWWDIVLVFTFGGTHRRGIHATVIEAIVIAATRIEPDDTLQPRELLAYNVDSGEIIDCACGRYLGEHVEA